MPTSFFSYAETLRKAQSHLGDDEDAPIHRVVVDALIRMSSTDDPMEALRAANTLARHAVRFQEYWVNQAEGEDQ